MTWQPFMNVEPSRKKTVWVSRHGISRGNEEHVVQHWDDYELSSTGIAQAEQAKAWWNEIPVQWVITSPVLRARQTADILFGEIHDIDAGWGEQATPTLSGQPIGDVADKYPHLFQPNGWIQPVSPRDPVMEHFDTVTERAIGALLRAAQHTSDNVTNVATVTHGGVIAGLLHRAGQKDIPVDNLFVLQIEVSPRDGWRILNTYSPLEHVIKGSL